MQLPYSEELNIGYLSRLFDNTTNCYKFFWFQAILSKLDSEHSRFTFDELINEMIADAWYMVTEHHSALSESDVDMQQAQNALDSLNTELRVLQKKRSVQLKYGRLATAIDMWVDDGMFDALTHLQIDKAQKRIARAIKQVENIRRELQKLL